jgi:hypothetical protein
MLYLSRNISREARRGEDRAAMWASFGCGVFGSLVRVPAERFEGGGSLSGLSGIGEGG